MALVLKDRVRETSTSTGTGTITLAGAVTGFQSFSVVGTGNTTYYTIVMGADWEVGLGTWTSPNQLSRDTVYESSNSNALVPFGSGTKDVFLTFPAEAVTSGGSGTVTQVNTSGTVSGITLTGGPITTTGTVTLGGSLDLSAPPAIGGTTPNTITGTTVTAVDAVGGSPASFVLNDYNNTGVTCTISIDQTNYSPTISATDGTTNYPLQLNDGVTFPAGVNLNVGQGNAIQLVSGVAAGATTSLYSNNSSYTAYSLYLPSSAGSNNQVLKTDGSGNLSWTDKFVLGAGTATAGTAPLKLTSGTNLTTAEAGAMEYNGTTVFITGTAASGRGVNLAPMMVRVNTDRAKTTNNTTLEAVFDAANDTLALAANTLYYFKGVYVITKSASATAAGVQIGFAFSNAQQEIGYKSIGFAAATGTAQTTIYNTVATAVTVTATATGATDYVVEFEGWFKSNATTGGTLIPQFTQSVVGTTVAPTAKANSWFMIQPMSSTPTATLIAGNWS